MAGTQCVKVEALRRVFPGNPDLEQWMAKEDSLYVGRRGRIFIRLSDGTNKVFVYAGSKWANPFKVGTKAGEYTLEESLRLYRDHVATSDLRNCLNELNGKILGCFCDQSGPCHAKVLIEMCKAAGGSSEPGNLAGASIDTLAQAFSTIRLAGDSCPQQTPGICTAIVKSTGKPCKLPAKINGRRSSWKVNSFLNKSRKRPNSDICFLKLT